MLGSCNSGTFSAIDRLLATFGLTLLVFFAATVARAEMGFLLVVHPSVPVTSLSSDQASACFLKKDTSWNDGSSVRPVTLADRTTSEAFDQAIHRRNSLAIRKYWQRQVFTGRGTPPPQLKTATEVLEYVSSTPGAIGYVPANADLSSYSVRKLRLVGSN